MRVHFTGIKGVGMAALALAYQDRGWEVTGSDTKDWQITDPALAKRGIKVVEKFTPRNIWVLKKMVWVPAIDKLIYTGAHHGAENVEVKWAASRGVATTNYAQALGEFFADKKQICVCGVGGKTTTAAMIATILWESSLQGRRGDRGNPDGILPPRQARGQDDERTRMDGDVGLDPSWIIGTSEIASLPAAGHWGNGEWAVIEGDEYVADPAGDKTPKFMYLNPKIVVCTNIVYDHPDVYKSEEEVEGVYRKLFEKTVKNGGKVIWFGGRGSMGNGGENRGIYRTLKEFRGKEWIEGPEEINRGVYRNLEEFKGKNLEEFKGKNLEEFKGKNLEEFKDKIRRVLKVPGEYNVRNALLAVAAAKEIGIPEEKAIAALAKYTGAKRRFELIGEIGPASVLTQGRDFGEARGISLYDDYAHHPAEITALAAAAREKFPGRRIRFVFQPHTFSRTKALFSEFADSLKAVDETVMYPIFASAREEKDETVSSQMLAEEIKRRGGKAESAATGEKLVEYLVRTAQSNEVIFTVGAGNLYEFHQKIIDAFSSKG